MIIKLLSILAGYLLTLAFAPTHWFCLALICPAMLLVCVDRCHKTRQAALCGWLFGFTLIFSGCFWIHHSITQFGHLSPYLAVLAVALIASIVACFYALVTTVWYQLTQGTLTQTVTQQVLLGSIIWVIVECIRVQITHFPYYVLGYSQTSSPLFGFAPLVGCYGLSLICIMLASLAVRAKSTTQRSILVICLGLLFATGYLLNQLHWTKKQGPPISALIVQGNLTPDIKWSADKVSAIVKYYLTLSQPWPDNQLIIWPEAAIPVPLSWINPMIALLQQQLQQHHSQLLTGIPITQSDTHAWYNGALLLNKHIHTMTKRRLVPFGEYTPFSHWLLPLSRWLNIPMSNVTPGNRIQPLLNYHHTHLLTLICYESSFQLDALWQPTASLFINLSDLAWFGEGRAIDLHIQMAAMRAKEFGRAMLMVGNGGASGYISSRGELLTELPSKQAQSTQISLQGYQGHTPFSFITLTPWWQVTGLSGLASIILLIARRKKPH